MQLALDITVLAFTLFLVQAGFRRSGKWIGWSLFFVVPLLLTPYWARVNDFGIFAWAKLYTILFSASWLTALRNTALGQWRFAPASGTALIALNILEAVAVDLAAVQTPQVMNAVAGILLVVTLPRTQDGFSRGWIISFTLWNWTFLYLNYPVLAGHHIVVLGIALMVGLANPACWLWARVFTLAFDLLLLATFAEFLLPRWDTSNWSDPRLEIVAAGIALTVGAMTAIHRGLQFESPWLTSPRSCNVPPTPGSHDARGLRDRLAPSGFVSPN